MDYFDLIAQRESCRAYADKPVEREKLMRLLEAARLAPSACNAQPWRFTIVTNPDLLAELAPCVQMRNMNPFASKCPALVVVEEMETNDTARIGGEKVGIAYPTMDIGLATMQLCLAATAQMLSTCIIGWLDREKIKSLLGLAGDPRMVLTLGYAAKDGAREKNRKPLEEVGQIID